MKVVKATLSNDETSSDDELVTYFTKEVGLSHSEAQNWVKKRDRYMGRLHPDESDEGKEMTIDEILAEVEDYHSENKLAGKWIAAGRAKYSEYAPKKFGYIFQDNYGFTWKVDPRSLEVDGINQDVLMDCIDQLEEMGSFEELRKKYPTPTDLRFYGGFLNSGLVITSRKNPLVTMSVTFHSSDRQDSPDIQVGWFYDEHRDLEANKMDNLTIRSVGEPHQDVRKDKGVEAEVEGVELGNPMLVEEVLKRTSKEEKITGRVVWFQKKLGKGVVESDSKKQFYFDQSTILVEDVQSLKTNTMVKFTPRYVRESSVWVADDLEVYQETLNEWYSKGDKVPLVMFRKESFKSFDDMSDKAASEYHADGDDAVEEGTVVDIRKVDGQIFNAMIQNPFKDWSKEIPNQGGGMKVTEVINADNRNEYFFANREGYEYIRYIGIEVLGGR